MGVYLCIATNAVPPSVSKRVVVDVECKYLSAALHPCLLFYISCNRQVKERKYLKHEILYPARISMLLNANSCQNFLGGKSLLFAGQYLFYGPKNKSSSQKIFVTRSTFPQTLKSMCSQRNYLSGNRFGRYKIEIIFVAVKVKGNLFCFPHIFSSGNVYFPDVFLQ